ncbi:MAG: hypothetical protein KY429_11350, partial [Actinobacteria bacterium]|nr:hypothetical protein [Actinomycetota bacterium]
GEQEMLAVGRALMSSPKLILVDEASQGLSPIAVEHLFETLKAVNESGVTMLMVEQNVSFTLGIADRVLVMQKGEIVYQGESSELDRDRLADLLGIGALLGSKVLAPEPISAGEEDSEGEDLEDFRPPRAKPKTKPVSKRKTSPRKKAAGSQKPAARGKKKAVSPAKKTVAKKASRKGTPVKRKSPVKARTPRNR